MDDPRCCFVNVLAFEVHQENKFDLVVMSMNELSVIICLFILTDKQRNDAKQTTSKQAKESRSRTHPPGHPQREYKHYPLSHPQRSRPSRHSAPHPSRTHSHSHSHSHFFISLTIHSPLTTHHSPLTQPPPTHPFTPPHQPPSIAAPEPPPHPQTPSTTLFYPGSLSPPTTHYPPLQ